jgi:hypothetical protein
VRPAGRTKNKKPKAEALGFKKDLERGDQYGQTTITA